MKTFRRDWNAVIDNQTIVYDIDMENDINYELSDEVIVKNHELVFLMKRGDSLVNQPWSDIVKQKTVLGEDCLTIEPCNVAHYARRECSNDYAKMKTCAMLYSEYELQDGEIIKFHIPTDLDDSIYDFRMFLFTKEIYHFHVSQFDANIDYQIGIVNNESWGGVIRQDGAEKFMTVSNINDCWKEQEFKLKGNVYVDKKNSICVIDGQKLSIPPINNQKFVSIYAAVKRIDSGDLIIVKDEDIVVGKDGGIVEFSPIRLENGTSRMKLLTVTQGDVIFEQFNCDIDCWEDISETKCVKCYDNTVRIRTKMHTGDKIRKITLIM